jgi:putative peptidoglycan lipid II flippase
MSGMSASNDFQKIRNLYSASLRGSLFFAIPATIALMTIGLPIISVLFIRGEFNQFDASMTNKALFFASIGIISLSVVRITVPVFYTIKNIRIPVIAASVSFISNILFGYLLMDTGLKHAGLTLAVSIAATIQMIILLFSLRKKIGNIDIKTIIIPIIKYIISGMIMAAALFYFRIQIDWLTSDFLHRFFCLFTAIITGSIIYLTSCYFLKADEVLYLINAFIKKIQKQ